MRRLALTLVVHALSAGIALSAPVRLVDANGKVVPIAGDVIVGGETIRVKDGAADLPVPDGGAVDAEFRSPGWWALPATVSASGAQMRVWRTGTLTGRALAAKGVTLPASFTAYIESPPHPVPSPPIPRGTKFDCPIDRDGRFTCDLPAETLDLAFRSKGLTPHYRWDVAVKASQTTDLGTLTWKAGASFVVWLDRKSAKAVKNGATARLTHMVAGAPSMTAARLSVPVAEARFNERGYAQLAPLEAGTFALEIVAPGFATAKIAPVEIYAGSESVFRKPVVLELPFAIHGSLTPPLDARGQRWRVQFGRLPDASSPLSGTSREIVADEQGSFVVEEQSPGRFHVTVSDSEGNRVAAKQLDVQSAAEAFQSIAIEQHIVRGTVTLGDEPLEADVVFGMRDGAERVTVKSDEGGSFSAGLPRLGFWPVEVRSDAAGVSVAVMLKIEEDEELEIRVPDSSISGEVLDADGQRVPRAQVRVLAGQLVQSYETDETGLFRIRGVTGRLTVTAAMRRSGQESADLALDLRDGQHVRDVKLRLLERREIRGRVSSAGQPLPGVSVTAYPSPSGSIARVTTDVDGRFLLKLRANINMATFVVAAPGRTMAAFQRPLSNDPVELDIEAVGGELIVWMNEKTERFSIFHNGVQLGLQELFEWAEAHGGELIRDRARIVAPDLARGAYRACAHLITGGDVCGEAMLVPRGSVTIDLR